MLTLNEQYLKLAFGDPLKSRVAAEFPCHVTIHTENKKISRTLLFLLSDINVINETILLIFKLV